MKQALIPTVLLLVILAISVAAQTKVPNGKTIMLDGKCTTEEWIAAADVVIPNGFRLSFKKLDNYVFVCVKPPRESRFIVDLYLSGADKKLYTLHASAKLGERVLEGGKWKDWTADWPWWVIDGWWANVSRPADFSKTQFLPREGLEFQIDRRRFSGNRWRMMFDIGGEPPVIFPANADNLKSDTWLELDLGR